MKKTLLIGIGGMAGAWLRFGIKSHPLFSTESLFPWHTILANLLACLLIGVFAGLLLDRHIIGAEMRLLLVTGFLGALSTFSTVCRETWNLIASGHVPTAFVYAAASLGFGYLAVQTGAFLADRIPWVHAAKEDA